MPNDPMAGDRRHLCRFERVEELRFLPRDFSHEAGELTFTLKRKRRAIEASWKSQLEGMYAPDAEGLA